MMATPAGFGAAQPAPTPNRGAAVPMTPPPIWASAAPGSVGSAATAPPAAPQTSPAKTPDHNPNLRHDRTHVVGKMQVAIDDLNKLAQETVKEGEQILNNEGKDFNPLEQEYVVEAKSAHRLLKLWRPEPPGQAAEADEEPVTDLQFFHGFARSCPFLEQAVQMDYTAPNDFGSALGYAGMLKTIQSTKRTQVRLLLEEIEEWWDGVKKGTKKVVLACNKNDRRPAYQDQGQGEEREKGGGKNRRAKDRKRQEAEGGEQEG